MFFFSDTPETTWEKGVKPRFGESSRVQHTEPAILLLWHDIKYDGGRLTFQGHLGNGRLREVTANSTVMAEHIIRLHGVQ
jgi:hypothetical protein